LESEPEKLDEDPEDEIALERHLARNGSFPQRGVNGKIADERRGPGGEGSNLRFPAPGHQLIFWLPAHFIFLRLAQNLAWPETEANDFGPGTRMPGLGPKMVLAPGPGKRYWSGGLKYHFAMVERGKIWNL